MSISVPPASTKRSSMRYASSTGVASPMSMVPRARRLTVSGPSVAVSMSTTRSHAVRRVCVYAGSNPGATPPTRRPHARWRRLLAERGIGLVYGGGKVGLMGVLADTVLAAGGEAIGVMPQALIDREIGHRGLTELRVVDSMHERKALMAELSDAFVAVPGGIGTLEELIEVYTWSQLGIHDKACGVLNVRGYYDHLAAFLDHAVDEGFLRAAAPRGAQRGRRPGRAARPARRLRAADGRQVAGARSDLILRPLEAA